jgi:alpha-tubulin suppressor-like RCC1 family protein
MNIPELPNEFQTMKSIQTALLLYCFVCLPDQFLSAAPARGQVIGWGENRGGQATSFPSASFSNGTFSVTGSPFATGCVMIAGQVLNNATAISAGTFHSLALRVDGTVAGWGDNYLGEALGDKTPDPATTNGVVKINGQILSNVVSVAAGRTFSLALKKDGNIVTWGQNYVPAGLSNIVAIATEWGCSWALKRNGTVVGWANQPSNHDYGQLTTVENLSNVIAITVGPGGDSTRGVALRGDGTVVNWGGETIYKDATPPKGLSNVVAIATGYNHSLALTRDGIVTGWGFNNVGQATGTPSTNSPSISAGQVIIAGRVLSNVVSIAAGRGYSLALKGDGTVIAWGRMVDDLYPATVPAGLSKVVAIAAGENFCLAITTNSAVADKFRH